MSFLPSIAADTFAGQLQWFMSGFIYSSVIASVSLMVRIFSMLGKSSPDI